MKRWQLVGYDTFEGGPDAFYPLSEHDGEEACVEAARERMRVLEVTQPSESSGGQDGIQDRVYIVAPDGTRYRFTMQAMEDATCQTEAKPAPSAPQPPYVTVTYGLRGFYAVLLTWQADDCGGFYEPFQTGLGSFTKESHAIPEALAWARDEGIPFRLQGYDDNGNPLS